MAAASDNDTATTFARKRDRLFDFGERLGLDVQFGEGRKGARPSVMDVVRSSAEGHSRRARELLHHQRMHFAGDLSEQSNWRSVVVRELTFGQTKEGR